MPSDKELFNQHISQQFNDELEEIRTQLLEMGGLVEKQINDAIVALIEGDAKLAQQVRELGIADKVVIGVMMPLLIGLDLINGWHQLAVYLILTREFVISGLREYLAGSLIIHVTQLAKWKTTLQLVATGAILLAAAFVAAFAGALASSIRAKRRMRRIDLPALPSTSPQTPA